jgi:hypothetical protein
LIQTLAKASVLASAGLVPPVEYEMNMRLQKMDERPLGTVAEGRWLRL